MSGAPPLLGIDLGGRGAHPGAAADGGAAAALADPRRLVRLARLAESAGVAFVALPDGDDPPEPTLGQAPVRLDAVLALSHLAAATTDVGLLATAPTTHREPFHLSKDLATLDHVSAGRAAWRVEVSTTEAGARRYGRKAAAPEAELLAEAADVVEVVRRLWDSWEDDAVIRDAPTGRYVDRERLHPVDFSGDHFTVRGPSITPRPPQGQPLVAVEATSPSREALAAAVADLVLVRPGSPEDVPALRRRLEQAAVAAGRDPSSLRVVAVLGVGESDARRRLDAAGARRPPGPELVGAADEVAAGLVRWGAHGVDAVLVEPDRLPDTLDWLVADVVPALGGGGPAVPTPGSTLRERFGLSRPTSRYATSGGVR